ncbi:hypothetical protein V6N11_018324 [Hibiscus sabdariffa]|uniref:Uncharacterized protein n=1 Tax=Hibiscus sabdariffa TaxID=183260 RepID=A0ABR2T7I1_9ROSI
MNEKQEPPFQVGGKEEVIQVRIQEKGESCSQAQAKCKSIKGHVETDDLWKLKSVVEKGFTDNSTVVEDALGRKEDKVSTMHSSGSQSDSSSETNRRQTQDVDVGNKLQSVDEATNAVFLGKEKNIDYSNRFLGECDLLGTNCIDGHEASRVGYVKKDTPTLNMKDGLTDECLIYA